MKAKLLIQYFVETTAYEIGIIYIYKYEFVIKIDVKNAQELKT